MVSITENPTFSTKASEFSLNWNGRREPNHRPFAWEEQFTDIDEAIAAVETLN
jgi:hypothetical protein